MVKSKHFSGQPILGQLLLLVSKASVSKLAKQHASDHYVKRFTTYKHLVVMLFATFEGCGSLREVVLGLLANGRRLLHVGLGEAVGRSTLSDANRRRPSMVFAAIYGELYRCHRAVLSDSRDGGVDQRRLFIMDSTTITLFKDILKGTGRTPSDGRRKGGIKAHTLIRADEHVPCLIRYTAAARHDHHFLREAEALSPGSFITFDKGYVDYSQYERFSGLGIWYVTRLKDNATYSQGAELDIPDHADPGVLKDELITLHFDGGKHTARRIAYWDDQNRRLLVFLTNNLEIEAEKVALIYRRRWQIELLFKQLKQNFPLKYFLGDNVNAIEIQIWCAMIANLLLTVIRASLKRKWAFSNMVSVIRQQLMAYININAFLENPEQSWRELNRAAMHNVLQHSLFPQMKGACF